MLSFNAFNFISRISKHLGQKSFLLHLNSENSLKDYNQEKLNSTQLPTLKHIEQIRNKTFSSMYPLHMKAQDLTQIKYLYINQGYLHVFTEDQTKA